MKTAQPRTSAPAAPKAGELAELRGRLAEAQETLRAIRAGEVDSVVITGRRGDRVFTLEGADHAYRVLIESMNEGALALTADATILYANQSFARMVRCPLEQVIGGSFRRFLPVESRAELPPLLKRSGQAGATLQVELVAGDGSHLPAQLSTRPLAKSASSPATIGLVVTDLTESRRTEERMRALTRRVVQVQEAERGRVAAELHNDITQPLCAVLFRSKTLADRLSTRSRPEKKEAKQLLKLLGHTAAEVERISSNLRPGVMEHLGLVEVLRTTGREFAARTGLSVKFACPPLAVRLPADTELAFFRIVQETLKNVEQHARARHVTVSLKWQDPFIELTIEDDGIGFNPDHPPTGKKGQERLGLLSLRERAAYVGGTLVVETGRSAGTLIKVRAPLVPPRPVLAS